MKCTAELKHKVKVNGLIRNVLILENGILAIMIGYAFLKIFDNEIVGRGSVLGGLFTIVIAMLFHFTMDKLN